MKQITLPLRFEKPEHAEIPTEMPSLMDVQTIALDTETTGVNFVRDKPVGISIAFRNSDLKSFYFPFGHSEGNMDEDKVRRWVCSELIGKEVIFCNAKFDLAILKNWGVDLESLAVKPRDVAFNGALLDDNRRSGFGLDDLAQKYLGDGKLTVQGGIQHLEEAASWMISDYAKQDASLTLRLHEATMPMIREQGLETVLRLENDIIYCVCHIERNGARLNVAKLEQWIGEVIAQRDWALLEIYRRHGLRVNPNSNDDLHRLFGHLGVKSPAIKGKRGLAGFTDERLQKVDHPVIELIQLARHADSMLSKFLEKFRNGLDGDVIRFQLHQLKGDEELGTISGRFSSSGGGRNSSGYGFNAQQVIKTGKQIAELGNRWLIRELFIPDDGYVFFSSDASQIEYRLMAHYAANPEVLKAYADNPEADYHAVVLRLLRPLLPNWQSKSDKEVRELAKRVNFARLYGSGPPKMSYLLGLDGSTSIPKLKPEEYETHLPETMGFLRVYDQILPEAKDLMGLTLRLARNRGWVRTLLGRRARFTPEDRHYSALNRIVQGTAADYMKLTLRDLYRERETLGIHKLRQPIHDEQCGDVDPDPLCQLRLAEFFNEQRIAELKVPVLWDTRFGKNWRECK